VIPTADRYAVFREIIDQEMHQDSFHQESIESNNSNSLEDERGGSSFEFAKELDNSFSPVMDSQFKSPTPVQMAKIDTNITDAISGAKDRYAALRDIILVQDLFDKTAMPPLASISDSNLSDDQEDVEQVFDAAEAADNNSIDNVPTYSISWADAEANQSEVSDTQHQDDQKSLQIISTSQKDDLEIDEYMKKAISELSLDQRLSPNIQAAKLSPSPCQLEKPQTNVNDMSTSPIPIFASKSPQQAEKENSPCMVEQPEEAVTNKDKSSLDENIRSEESRGKLIMTNGLADFRDKVSSYIFLSLRLS
jgi:disabled homolog 2